MKRSNGTTKGITTKTRSIAASACLLALTVFGSATFTAKSATQQAAETEAPAGLLMLVRAWDPGAGELIGWMPMHRVALTLQFLGKEPPSFDLNEAVTADFPYRPEAPVKYGRVSIASEVATFQGRDWLPVQRDPNIVRIRGSMFYVKSIDFGESKWRRSTAVSPVNETQRK